MRENNFTPQRPLGAHCRGPDLFPYLRLRKRSDHATEAPLPAQYNTDCDSILFLASIRRSKFIFDFYRGLGRRDLGCEEIVSQPGPLTKWLPGSPPLS
jgi:hypothetical protein